MSNQLRPTTSLDDVRVIRFREFREPNGTLVPLTVDEEIPFPVSRMFFVHSVPESSVRGDHAHIACNQLFIAASGRCEIAVDDGTRKRIVMLDAPSQGIYVPPGIWATQRYLSSASVLFVLADLPFDEADYIREHAAFLAFRGLAPR